MKIKQVCEQTGLTDRTVRYYIGEGLLSPAYTENYMGRRAYDFTEADVAVLENVATLRRFGFSIEQIRVLLKDPAEGRLVIDDLVRSKKAALKEESGALQALERLPYSTYTAAELADWLRLMNYKEPKPPEEVPPDWDERLGNLMKCAFWMLLAALPVGCFIDAWIDHAFQERYAVISGWGWAMLAATLLPAMVLLWLGARRACGLPVPGKRLLAVLLVGCALWQPVSFRAAQGIFGMSETTDMDHYMLLDTGVNAHLRRKELELFPVTHGHRDETYYYRWDADMLMFDICAEWTLDAEKLEEERLRTEAVLRAMAREEDSFYELETDGFRCMFYVSPTIANLHREKSRPFLHRNQHWEYACFAWNEETGRVRYCLGSYFMGRIPCEPYYMSLEW